MKRHILTGALAAVLLAGPAGATSPPSGPLTKCPPDAVVSGAGCMDKYEASVWRVPNPRTANRKLVAKIQQGKATVALLMASGAISLPSRVSGYAPCADNGQNCADDIYAVSLPGVMPSAAITWFQAQQACTNSGKRLPSNAEWQAAVAGTPDPGPDNGTTDCNSLDVTDSGAGVSPTSDIQCLAGAATTGEPGALIRGGFFDDGSGAGPLSIAADNQPSNTSQGIGFRCVR